MNTKLVVAALIALLGTAARAGQEFRFKGELVQDSRSGWTAIGDDAKRLLAVTSLRHHYGLILPYAEDWTFTTGESPLLGGNSGLVNLTVKVEECDESPEQHLRTLQARLGKSPGGKKFEKSEIVIHKKEPVLRIVEDAEAVTGRSEFRGVKMIHFHAAKRWGKLVYVYHLSRVVSSEEAGTLDEKALLNYATVGFRVDFMRDEGQTSK